MLPVFRIVKRGFLALLVHGDGPAGNARVQGVSRVPGMQSVRGVRQMGRVSGGGQHILSGGKGVSRRGREDHLKGGGRHGSQGALGGDGEHPGGAVLLRRVVEGVEVQRFVDVFVIRHGGLAFGWCSGGGGPGHMDGVVTRGDRVGLTVAATRDEGVLLYGVEIV